MNRDQLIERMATGFFAPRPADARLADALLAGSLKLGEDVVDVTDPGVFDRAEDLPRVQLLALHSLRWLDVLRRVRSDRPGAEDAWLRIFEAWAASSAAEDPESAAWGFIPFEQRCVAIALGAPAGSAAIEAIPRHLEMLGASEEKAATAAERLRILRIHLALRARRGDDDEQLREVAVAAAEEVFRENGYAVAEDLAGIVETAGEWETELRALDVPTDPPVFTRLHAEDFWLAAMGPDGALVPMGGALPDPVPGAESSQMRYVVTGGEEGSPPESIRHVDPEGLVSLRSGWGETERDAREETHVSMLLGPVRGREAHHDPARITYHSQGRDWLIDPVAPEAAGDDAHSIVHVEDIRYRILGGADLVRHYADDRLDGFVVKTSLHLAVQWQRHMVYARTGNYVVVDDLIRHRDPLQAQQQWIVAPDVEVEVVPDGFRLHADGKTVSLVTSTGSSKAKTVDELLDGSGTRFAWRLRVPMEGASARAIAIISDVVDPEKFSVRRVPYSGKEFTVDLADKQLDETLVVTPELSTIVPSGLDPEEAITRTIAYAAAGSLTEEEALEQRLAVRRAIHDAKDAVREAGESVASREQALRTLLQAAEDLRVTGLRDHGLAAALIDIAGTDLAAMIEGNRLVGNVRRSPLVDWAGQDLVQPSYSVPVRTTLDPGALPEGVTEPSVWSVDLGQLVPSTYLLDGPGDVLTVYFHGSTDRSRLSMPRYERLRSLSQLGLGPVMFFSDPSLDLDSRMMLSWYVGNEDVDLHQAIARMIEAYARHRGLEKVLLVGNSGGGFTALQLGAYLEGTRVVSFNPQIQIDRYVPRIADTAHWALFGRTTVSDDPVNAPRMDLIERYRRLGFDQDVVLIQNPGDDMHYQDHFLPFQEAFEGSTNASRLTSHTPYLGPGHRVPPPQEYLEYVRDAAAQEQQGEWRLRGLREGVAATDPGPGPSGRPQG
ncbi:hypothetical protein DEO23_05650 [Brachybacterium endophyticum]|uniref:Alpha/beta hydrolase n=1 Tax=Brachybacterium endophyticum TaxID=2182385 RepID=A0A2U2RKZ6_9MICO|nr:hypothetical protein [Brachybacterium endophyticum]PWH06454.1 hypothetical protein DEO23_05650 [Brachybacterium endophyticum]